MPVFNGATTLRKVLESLVSQTFSDFVLVISDNASTDNTAEICLEYVRSDERIRYIRQSGNIGAEANFRYVFDAEDSEYFMWAAADDVRSTDFIELNLAFLQANPEYLGSTCPVRFEGGVFDEVAMGDAALADDDPYKRLTDFFGVWHANGRFYSLFRRAAITAWVQRDNYFLGSDWTLITHLALAGKLNRVSGGWIELGLGGVSNTKDIFANYRQGIIDWIIPFHRLTRDTLQLMGGASRSQKLLVIKRLLRLNIQAFATQFRVMIQRRRTRA
jgi:glycosyltransferase involved in cell wall biosynthesis